jgi:hypothetical protein
MKPVAKVITKPKIPAGEKLTLGKYLLRAKAKETA